MKHLSITQVISPHTFDYKEAIYYCKTFFGVCNAESNRILKHLVSPSRIAPDKMYFYIARKGDEFAGFVIVYYLDTSKLAFLEFIGVRPEMRRDGIGSILYDHVLNLIRNDHPEARGMFYEVSQDEEGLETRVKFFLSQGAQFFDVPELEAYFKRGKELQLMYHSFDNKWFITRNELPQVMQNLTSIIV